MPAANAGVVIAALGVSCTLLVVLGTAFFHRGGLWKRVEQMEEQQEQVLEALSRLQKSTERG